MLIHFFYYYLFFFLGKTVHKLCRHSNSEVASAAKSVYKCWRTHIVQSTDKPSIAVQYDAKTKHIRNKARLLLLGALKNEKSEKQQSDSSSEAEIMDIGQELPESSDLESLAEYIEREVFKAAQNRTTNNYRKANRRIVFALKYKKDVKLKVKSAEISVQQLVKEFFEKV